MKAKESILKRQERTRNKIKTSSLPRVSVFRSNKYFSAQIIDDQKKVTIVGVTEKTVKTSGSKTDRARILGKELASLAKAKKVNKIVFDRGRYSYHGRVKAFAEALREGGLKF